MENLALAGALDCFPQLHRAQYFYAPATDPITGIERLIRFANQFQASSAFATNSLFGEMAMPDVKPPVIPECEKWNLHELLEREKEVVGIYLSAHPLDGFRFEMENYGFTPVTDLEENKGKPIRIAGFVTDVTHMTTKKGSKFGKLVLNDYSGNFEIILWENNYVKYGNFLVNNQKIMIQGSYEVHKYRPGVMEFQIQNMMLLDDVRKLLTKRLHMSIPLNRIDSIFINFIETNVRNNPGNSDLVIHVMDDEDNWSVRLKLPSAKIVVTDEMIRFLQENEHIRYSLEKS